MSWGGGRRRWAGEFGGELGGRVWWRRWAKKRREEVVNGLVKRGNARQKMLREVEGRKVLEAGSAGVGKEILLSLQRVGLGLKSRATSCVFGRTWDGSEAAKGTRDIRHVREPSRLNLVPACVSCPDCRGREYAVGFYWLLLMYGACMQPRRARFFDGVKGSWRRGEFTREHRFPVLVQQD